MFETDLYAQNYIERHIKIYELHSIMNFTKITSNESAHTAIRGNNYIVGSITNGLVSISSNPAVHYGVDTARAECKRLARMYPGVTYFFTQLKGAELVPTMSVSI